MDKWLHETAYVYMLGSAFFGGLFVWMMIFITHIIFRRRAPVGALRFAPPGPWSSLLGLAALTAVLISTWWVPGIANHFAGRDSLACIHYVVLLCVDAPPRVGRGKS